MLKKLFTGIEFIAQGIGHNGVYMLILELNKVVVAIQGSIVRIGGFHIGNDAGTAVVVVGREVGIHIGGRSLGEVVVISPKRGWHDELRLDSCLRRNDGLRRDGGCDFKDASVHHAADIGGILIEIRHDPDHLSTARGVF